MIANDNQVVTVGVLTTVHRPLDVRVFHRQCRTLARAGFEVTLIVPGAVSSTVDGVNIRPLPPAGNRLARMSITVWRAYREAVSLNADVYHLHDPELIPIGLMLRRRGKKVIYDIHEHVPQEVAAKPYLPRRVRKPAAKLIEELERYACRRFAALVCATPAIARPLQGLNRRCVIVQNFPHRDEFARPAGNPWSLREQALAYIGGMSAKRGLREIIRAMELLPARLGATLKLAGRYSPRTLRDELAGLPGWSHVEDFGEVQRTQISHILAAVRVGIVLYHPGPEHDEAQPNKLFEYMSAGIPVVASNFPLWRRFVEGTSSGLVVNPLDPQAIAEAITFLLDNPAEAQRMGERGRELVDREFNWEAEEEKLLRLYSSLEGSTAGGIPIPPATRL